MRFDPASGAVALADVALPTPDFGASAVWDGAHASQFGGYDHGEGPTADIVRYTPEAPDRQAPDTVIDSTTDGHGATIASGGSTTSPSLELAFRGTDDVAVAALECSLDAAAYAGCASPTAYSALAVGAHSFSVRAVDVAGNVDATPAWFHWNVTDARSDASRMLDDLEERVEDLAAWSKVRSKLLAHVYAAEAKLDDTSASDDLLACKDLQSFTSDVQKMRAKGELTRSDGDGLRADAKDIRDELGC